MLKFPEDFLFGTATAAHQIEGENRWNDWWYYEQIGKLPYKSGKTCNHWEMYREDIELMKKLGYNAYRFSIEWSRVFPKENVICEKSLQKYQNIIDLLNENSIVPMATLHHFTLPKWFVDKGGFANKKNLKYWEEYIRVIRDNIHGVSLFATFNEPMVYVSGGYLMGEMPPFIKNPFTAGKVEANILNAHAIAYEILKSKNVSIGIVKNIPVFERKSDNLRDEKAANRIHKLFNTNFLDAIWSGKLQTIIKKYSVIKSDSDFIGVNYYNRVFVSSSINPFKFFFNIYYSLKDDRKTMMGWSVYPEGIYTAIKIANSYKRPIYITENGIATKDDDWRIEFIIQHLQYIHKAIREGIDVRGYFYWSFMDNFEWDKGFRPRFGLINIDYDDFKRTPRKSAYLYGKIAKNKILEDTILEKYGKNVKD